MQTTAAIGEKLFEETARLTGIKEYGVSWDEFVAGNAAIPPQGARFDIAFEGTLTGDRINGSLTGLDFLTVRADGRFELNIYITITTDDGATISFEETGTLIPLDGAPAELYMNMRFSTAHEQYEWLNKLPAWGRGTVDMATGEIAVTAFTG